MVTTKSRPKLVAIVGPTASGKSALAMHIAREFDGEIICADSRTVYKDMDIGTAKPLAVERQAVPHWGLDLVEPGETFSAGKFKPYAEAKILDIQKRGKLPILVGGSGLYVDGLLYDYGFSLVARERDPINPRHLKKGNKTVRGELLEGTLLVGLLPPDALLKQRIAARAEAMFEQGIIKETQGLLGKYGRKKITGTGGIAYRAVLSLIGSEIDKKQATELIKTQEWQYARRQKTWFRRNEHIMWFNSADMAYIVVKKALLNT